MKCLVVTAHPLSHSLCKLLTKRVVSKLVSLGHDVVEEDLYVQQFDPSLTVVERETYYSGNYEVSDIEGYVERLLEAEALVLLFPTWWFGFPAILKGWFDRVWGPSIAYDHATDYGPIKPRLSNLRRTLVVTTLGAPWWVDWLLMRQPVRRIVKVALLGSCARKSKLQYLSLCNSEKLNKERITAFESRIDRVLEEWKL